MSIRAIALDLYKAHSKVTSLQKKIVDASPAEKDALTRELQSAQKELQILRKILDGEKESGSFRLRFSGFGGRKL